MHRSKTSSLLATAALALASAALFAQEPEPNSGDESAGAAEARPDPAPRARSREVVRVGADATIPAGDRVREVVVVLGDAVVEGAVEGEAVVVAGSLRLASTAVVKRAAVVVGGELVVEEGASVGGDLVVVGGSLEAPPQFAPGGETVVVGSVPMGAFVAPFAVWVTEGLFWGRPIVPTLPVFWVFIAVLALLYFAINFAFDSPVRRCSEVLQAKPLTACIAGILVIFLIGPVSLVLVLSVVGLPVLPFLWLGLLVVGVFGRVAFARWLGGRIVAEEPDGGRLLAARSLALGLAVIVCAYMVPVLGFVVWMSIGVVGLGAAAATVVEGIRKEHPAAAPAAAGGPVPGSDPHAASDSVPGGLGSLVIAGFASRLGALAIDCILVTIASAFLSLEAPAGFALMLAYHVVLWAWKGTTIGGIVCQVRVVRFDGSQPLFSDALVRGLAAIFSVVVAGLGWFWILWDPQRQSWHDKIANTYVVRVPPDRGPDVPAAGGPDPVSPAAGNE